jgi:hypothetical protein
MLKKCRIYLLWSVLNIPTKGNARSIKIMKEIDTRKKPIFLFVNMDKFNIELLLLNLIHYLVFPELQIN